MRIEVVTVSTEHAGEAVSRIGDLDLDSGQPPGKEGAEEAGANPVGVIGGPAPLLRRRKPGRQLRLQPVLGVAVDQVVVVVAGEEDEPLPRQLLGNQSQQAVGGIDGVADRTEEEVEEVAEKDQLVDPVQLRRQPFQKGLLAE